MMRRSTRVAKRRSLSPSPSPPPSIRRGPGRPWKHVKEPEPVKSTRLQHPCTNHASRHRSTSNDNFHDEAEMSEGDTIVVNLKPSIRNKPRILETSDSESDDVFSEEDTIVVNIRCVSSQTQPASESSTDNVPNARSESEDEVLENVDVSTGAEYTKIVESESFRKVRATTPQDVPTSPFTEASDLYELPRADHIAEQEATVSEDIRDEDDGLHEPECGTIPVSDRNIHVEQIPDPTPPTPALTPTPDDINEDQEGAIRDMEDFEVRLMLQNKKLVEENDKLHHEKDAGHALVQKLRPICKAYHEDLIRANAEVERYKRYANDLDNYVDKLEKRLRLDPSLRSSLNMCQPGK